MQGEKLAWLEANKDYDGEGCLTWPFEIEKSGYAKVAHEGGKEWAHRYVCKRVNGPPPTPKHEARHTCGRGQQTCVDGRHLIWGTRKQNAEDRKAHGTYVCGSDVKGAKLTNEQAEEIKSLAGKEYQKVTAARFGVSRSLVGLIQKGKRRDKHYGD